MPFEILLPLLDWLMKPRALPIPGTSMRREALKLARSAGNRH
jgi:hypothetical protein